MTLTPCQTYANTEGVEQMDKLLFTTKARAIKGIALLCDECPSESKSDCAKRAQSIITPAGKIDPEGVFGGVFYE